jgi:DNA polymerase-3 subunit delta'
MAKQDHPEDRPRVTTTERPDDPRLPGTEGHPHARAVLEAALPPAGLPSHAYLFHGPPGSGKRIVARSFASALLSEGAPDSTGVAERVTRGAHPDLAWVTPSGAAEMLVSDIDQPVVAAASRTPFEATRRVFVIERAHTLNDQAANRLLKTLEEPPAFAHLLLLSDRPGDLLPTIRSRCQAVRFDPPSSEAIAAGLVAQDIEPETARACARLAMGDSEAALALAAGDGPALREAAESFARAGLAGRVHEAPWLMLLDRARRHGERAVSELRGALDAELELLDARDRRRHEREATERTRRASRRATTQALDRGLQLAGLWFRDIACLIVDAEDVVYATDRLPELRADAAGRDPGRLQSALEAVEDTRERLSLHVSEELACEALAYRLERELA